MTLPKFAYFRGKIVPYTEAKLGVMTHTLNYGTGVFGGLRGYWNGAEEQLFLFRPLEHYHRFLNSAKLLCAETEYTPEQLRGLTLEVLRKEALRQDCYVRPLLYKSDEIIGVRLHDLHDELTIFSVPFDRYIEAEAGAHVTISAWRRIDDNAVPARGKFTGAYINSAFIKTDAVRSGFDEALVLTQEGHLSEGSAENLFLLRDGVLMTPSVTENILEGITRKTVLTLAREELGLQVVERPIDRTEVYLCDEMFMTGTAAQVTPIVRVDHRPIADGRIGPITGELVQLYDDVVRGRVPKYRHWNEPVYVPEAAPVGG
ncbi:MAG: branched-chain amino acid transaminase [Anaerolineales bacterium]